MQYEDAGLESFLNLVVPDLGMPQMVFTPNVINLRLQREEKSEVVIRIANCNRGYLFGTVDLAHPLEGLSLSAGEFGVHCNDHQEAEVTLEIDATLMAPGRTYRNAIILNSNAENESISIPVVIEVYRHALAGPAALWLITVPLSLLAAMIIYLTVAPMFDDSLTAGIGPFVLIAAGLLGTVLYNALWSNSAKNRDNRLGDYVLSLLCFFGFALAGLVLMYLFIVVMVIIAIIIALFVMGSGKSR